MADMKPNSLGRSREICKTGSLSLWNVKNVLTFVNHRTDQRARVNWRALHKSNVEVRMHHLTRSMPKQMSTLANILPTVYPGFDPLFGKRGRFTCHFVQAKLFLPGLRTLSDRWFLWYFFTRLYFAAFSFPFRFPRNSFVPLLLIAGFNFLRICCIVTGLESSKPDPCVWFPRHCSAQPLCYR